MPVDYIVLFGLGLSLVIAAFLCCAPVSQRWRRGKDLLCLIEGLGIWTLLFFGFGIWGLSFSLSSWLPVMVGATATAVLGLFMSWWSSHPPRDSFASP